MKFYDIQEPGQDISEEKASPESIAVGIDLGTTNSLVAASFEGQVTIFPDSTGQVMLPSVLLFQQGGVLVGREALEAFEAGQGPLISSTKRLMGKGKKDIAMLREGLKVDIDSELSTDNDLKIRAGKIITSPVEVAGEILKALKKRAEQALGLKVDRAVITVPAYFDETARNATKNAARLAGIKVLRLLNEPTAAALAYGLDRNATGIYAIYDLGGGTFDISILKLQGGIFRVLAAGGDANLGGDDFDHLLLDYIYNKYNIKIPTKGFKGLILIGRRIKEYLTTSLKWQGRLPEIEKEVEVSRPELEAIITPLIDTTIEAFRRALKDAELDVEQLSEVILVGGSSRTPLIKQKLIKFIGRDIIQAMIDPDTIVAIGAALQAENLDMGRKSHLLLDVTPLSLGLEVMGGQVESIIPRNTPIPIAKKQMFTTQRDNQTGLKIHILQGESKKVEQCRSLARFELKGVPSMKAGEARIELSFQIDADGLLTVKAEEQTTRVTQVVEVKPSYGLTEAELVKLLTSTENNTKSHK
jgi:molecular chaperone HscA